MAAMITQVDAELNKMFAVIDVTVANSLKTIKRIYDEHNLPVGDEFKKYFHSVAKRRFDTLYNRFQLEQNLEKRCNAVKIKQQSKDDVVVILDESDNEEEMNSTNGNQHNANDISVVSLPPNQAGNSNAISTTQIDNEDGSVLENDEEEVRSENNADAVLLSKEAVHPRIVMRITKKGAQSSCSTIDVGLPNQVQPLVNNDNIFESIDDADSSQILFEQHSNGLSMSILTQESASNNSSNAENLTETPTETTSSQIIPALQSKRHSISLLVEDDACTTYVNSISQSKSVKMTKIAGGNSVFKESEGVKCDIGRCRYVGKTKLDLKQHVKIHSRDKPYQCEYCSKSFRHLVFLQQHRREHFTKNSKQLSRLQQIERIHTGESFVNLLEDDVEESRNAKDSEDTSQESVSNNVSNAENMNETSAETASNQIVQPLRRSRRSFVLLVHEQTCQTCENSTPHLKSAQTIEVARGNSVSQKVKDAKCEVENCKYVGKTNALLKQHMTIHSRDKPYQCDHCSKSFSHLRTLQQHTLIHTGEKPYHCKQCFKKFNQLSQLHQHERIHTGEHPYQCGQCSKKFIQQCHLQQHERTHSGIKPYGCGKCSQKFTQLNHLRKHMQKEHA